MNTSRVLRRRLWTALAVPMALLSFAARAEGLAEPVQAEVQRLADGAARAVAAQFPGARLSVEVGEPDPRLRLAPCRRTEVYLPTGARLWGRSRVGVRCVDGERPWNISVPVTVRLLAPSLVAAGPLPAGTVLTAAHLRAAPVDLADGSPPVLQMDDAIGRTLAGALQDGEPLRHDDLRSRRFFDAGSDVQVVAVGSGFRVTGRGQALGHGIEGRPVRVRTEGGRVVTGTAAGDRRVEIPL